MILAGAALLVLTGLWIYSPVFHGGWVWDDIDLIPRNPCLRNLAGLGQAWTSTPISNYWPATWTLFWTEWHLWGPDPTGYHLVGIGLHLIGALLFWRLLARLGLRWAWLAATLFAVHPLAVESVAWVSETKNTLSLVFFLSSLDAYVAFDTTERRPVYFASLAFFLLALLSKTSVVMLPLVLLLHCWWKRNQISRRDLARIAPYLALAVIFGAITLYFESAHAPADPVVDSRGLAGRVVVALSAIGFYLEKILVPVGLLPVYPRWPIAAAWPSAAGVGVILACGLGLLWAKRASWGRTALLGFGFFLLTILPVLGFGRMDYMNISWVADHFSYLPMLGIVALVVCGLEQVYRHAPVLPRFLGPSVLAILAGLLAVQSRSVAARWTSSETLWSYTLARSPDCWLAHCSLAVTIQNEPGRREEAVDHYEEALHLKPDFIEAHNGLGSALADLPGRTGEAVTQLEEALRLKPDYDVAHFNLGCVLDKIPGKENEAASHYTEAIRLRPGFFEAHFNLGCTLQRMPGRAGEAADQFAQALRLEPNYVEVHYNLGTILEATTGRQDEAIRQFQEVLRLQPGHYGAHYHLGLTLEATGAPSSEAISHYRAALQLNPDFFPARLRLANALAKQPEHQGDAVGEYETVLRAHPDNLEAHSALAEILVAIPDRLNDAIAHDEEVVRLAPDNPTAHFNLGYALGRIPARTDEAMAEYQTALKLKPDYAEASTNLGIALLRQGHAKEGLLRVEAAIQLQPDFIPARLARAAALAQTGRKADAIAECEQVLRLAPNNAAAKRMLENLQAPR